VLTDKAIEWVGEQPSDKPWFLWLAYNAPHTPFHAPPIEMHSQGALPPFENGMNALPYYMAAIEAMDYQIGRLLDSVPADELENTVIIFMGDNGTPSAVVQAPYRSDSAKGTLFQGGVNTPLFVSGQSVFRRGLVNNLVSSVDLFSTLADIAGIENPNINDSISFKPLFSEDLVLRDYLYVEKDDAEQNIWAVSNGAYKLIVSASGNMQLYNLINDPYEQTDIISMGQLSTEHEAVLGELQSALDDIRVAM
jgi:arylsulfatase A-like enzyme